MASGPITSWQIDGETTETVADFIFLGSKITADGDCSHEIKRCLLCGRKAMTKLDCILKSRDITSESFQMSQLFASDGQSIRAIVSVLPMNIQDWFPLGWTGWISLLSKRLSRVFSKITVQKHQLFGAQFCLFVCLFVCLVLSHPHMTTAKTIVLTRWTFVGKVMSLLLNILCRLVIAFLPRSKHLLISWLQSPSAVIWEPSKKKKSKFHKCFHCFPFYLPWSDGTRCHDLTFLNVEF